MAQVDQAAGQNWRIHVPVDKERYTKSTTPAIEPEPIDLEDEAAIRAHKIRALPIGERLYVQGQIAARIKTMEKNIAQGYDWSRELEVKRKVLELSRLGMA